MGGATERSAGCGKEGRLNADAGLKLTKATMNEIQLGKVKLVDAISANNVTVEGRRQSVDDFVGLLDTFQLWFNIVTP